MMARQADRKVGQSSNCDGDIPTNRRLPTAPLLESGCQIPRGHQRLWDPHVQRGSLSTWTQTSRAALQR